MIPTQPQRVEDQQLPATRPAAAISHPTVSALTTFTARYPALTPHQISGLLYYTSFNLVEAEVACSRLTAQESVDGVLWEVEEDEKLLRGVEWLDGRDGHAVEARRKFLKSMVRARREQGLEGLVMWHPSRET